MNTDGGKSAIISVVMLKENTDRYVVGDIRSLTLE
jgi:hypothetical protein